MSFSSLCRLTIAILVLCSLSSCAGTRFYSTVEGHGKLRGRPCIEWVKPDRFVYDQHKNGSFAFVRPNGEIIQPGSIETDGGSIPRFLWMQKGFSPWTYAPAYLIHDWMYEAHRRKVPAGRGANGTPLYYSKEQADWIMAEVIKCQMESKAYDTDRSPARLRRIYWAVSRFGKTAWNSNANLVDALLDLPLIGDVAENMPLGPALSSVQAQITPVPGKPAQKGTTTPQP